MAADLISSLRSDLLPWRTGTSRLQSRYPRLDYTDAAVDVPNEERGWLFGEFAWSGGSEAAHVVLEPCEGADPPSVAEVAAALGALPGELHTIEPGTARHYEGIDWAARLDVDGAGRVLRVEVDIHPRQRLPRAHGSGITNST